MNDEVNREMRTPWRSVITPDRWKLNLSTHDQCELYDLNNDPAELNNLYDEIGRASCRERV